MTAAPQDRGGNVSYRCCTPQTLLRAHFGGMYAVPQRQRRSGKVQSSRRGDEHATRLVRLGSLRVLQLCRLS